MPPAQLPHFARRPAEHRPLRERLRGVAVALRHAPETYRMVWRADRRAAVLLAMLTALAAVLPAAVAWVGKLIVDGGMVALILPCFT